MKTLIQAAVVAMFAASAAQAQQAVQWRVEDGGNGHWYVRVAESRTWSGHAAYAASIGAHLVTLTDAPENAFVHGQFPGRAWLGGFTEENQGCNASAWKWVTGEPWTHAPWAPPEPNYCDETRLEFSGPYPMRWNNYYGAAPNQAIIEWSADCNGDGIVDYGQILDGSLSDVNGDGVPDSCQAPCTPADLNDDGTVDGADLGALLADWGPALDRAVPSDLNMDGVVNGADLGALLATWGPCKVPPSWATVIDWKPDPLVVPDIELRSRIAETGMPWRVRDNGTGIELLLVPPGTFQMGCTMGSDEYECFSWEQPVHPVTLTREFYLGRYEVTQAQWVAAMGSNPSLFRMASAHVPIDRVDDRPVDSVSWHSVHEFLLATGMRLPTEAEWEFACRAGSSHPFYNGSADDGTMRALAWYSPNSSKQTRPVGDKAANALGFHDMLGNVWEWVNDWFAPYPATDQSDPAGPNHAPARVIRGGSFSDGTSNLRSSNRDEGAPALNYGAVGFRVAKDP